jgi:4-amino-4-deoxy-L-arabinose transferase-like glycosyltransferase
VDGADERSFAEAAWGIANGDGLDPHPFFDTPGLFLYVLAPLQVWEEAPVLGPARITVAVLGVAGVAAAWWLGTAAYDVLAGAIAAAATAVALAHVSFSQAALPDILLTTVATVALALAVSNRLLGTGCAVGVAVATKWSGIALAVPLAVAGWRRPRHLAYAAALGLAAFALTAPFALVHADESARDAWAGLESAWSDGPGLSFVGGLWESLGPALAVAAIGLVAALVQRRPEDRMLSAFVLVSATALFVLGARADRYVLPLVPALGALAGRTRSLAPVALLLLVVPLTWAIRDDELVGS